MGHDIFFFFSFFLFFSFFFKKNLQNFFKNPIEIYYNNLDVGPGGPYISANLEGPQSNLLFWDRDEAET